MNAITNGCATPTGHLFNIISDAQIVREEEFLIGTFATVFRLFKNPIFNSSSIACNWPYLKYTKQKTKFEVESC